MLMASLLSLNRMCIFIFSEVDSLQSAISFYRHGRTSSRRILPSANICMTPRKSIQRSPDTSSTSSRPIRPEPSVHSCQGVSLPMKSRGIGSIQTSIADYAGKLTPSHTVYNPVMPRPPLANNTRCCGMLTNSEQRHHGLDPQSQAGPYSNAGIRWPYPAFPLLLMIATTAESSTQMEHATTQRTSR